MTHIEELIEVMRRLRDPRGGCPWDLQQDFRSIAPYTIEEAYEVADVVEREALDELPGELGDLLLQVVFHAQMADEAGHFAFGDVVAAIVDKMVRRHPHVFADVHVADAASQTLAWEEHKRAERAERGGEVDDSALAGVTRGLPALLRALKLQKRAARVGFDWPNAASVLPKVREECAELEAELGAEASERQLEHELGDLMFSCVNLARHLKVDPERALRAANLRFEHRFRRVEDLLREAGKDIASADAESMERAWAAAKAEEARLGG